MDRLNEHGTNPHAPRISDANRTHSGRAWQAVQRTRAAADTALRITSMDGSGSRFTLQQALWSGTVTWPSPNLVTGAHDVPYLLWQAPPSDEKTELMQRMVEQRKRRCEYSRDVAWVVAVEALKEVAGEEDGEAVVMALRGTWRPWTDMFMLLTDTCWDTHIWTNPERCSRVRHVPTPKEN